MKQTAGSVDLRRSLGTQHVETRVIVTGGLGVSRLSFSRNLSTNSRDGLCWYFLRGIGQIMRKVTAWDHERYEVSRCECLLSRAEASRPQACRVRWPEGESESGGAGDSRTGGTAGFDKCENVCESASRSICVGLCPLQTRHARARVPSPLPEDPTVARCPSMSPRLIDQFGRSAFPRLSTD